ncbi:hypothetical protein TYRP_005543 [Tyrophagus putrescentiae]|nr:hypothetical protein TYRP_005543 [Tyrophagus putrescentiae]
MLVATRTHSAHSPTTTSSSQSSSSRPSTVPLTFDMPFFVVVGTAPARLHIHAHSTLRHLLINAPIAHPTFHLDLQILKKPLVVHHQAPLPVESSRKRGMNFFGEWYTYGATIQGYNTIPLD